MNDENRYGGWNLVLIIVILIIFLITLGILVYYIRYQTSTSSRADNFNSMQTVSIVNSYVFASPVRAKAMGDLIRITVFALDEQGAGLYDKKVDLKSDNSMLVVKNIQNLTDETGKALFDLSTDTVGTYVLDVYIDSLKLPQSVKVVFD